jgi:hypothetical protein
VGLVYDPRGLPGVLTARPGVAVMLHWLLLAKAFKMLGSWSSCRKTLVGTIAQLEPSLANSSVTSFFPHKICKYSRPSKLFSNLRSS